MLLTKTEVYDVIHADINLCLHIANVSKTLSTYSTLCRGTTQQLQSKRYDCTYSRDILKINMLLIDFVTESITQVQLKHR